MNMSEKFSNKIQILRGVAIFAVVLIHNTPSGLLQVWFRPFFNIAVGLFLFLSGLLSSADKWNPKRRIVKVLIPYVIWTFVYVLINNYKHIYKIPSSYINNLITTNSAAIMYFVFVYCELTLLIPLIDKISKSKIKWIGLLISPIEIIVMRLGPLVLGYGMNKYVLLIMHVSCIGWFTYFYLGYLIGNRKIQVNVSLTKLVVAWIVSIIFQILEGYWYLSMGVQNCGTQLKLSAILSGVIFMLIAHKYLQVENAPLNRFLKLLGDKSFGVYFSHLAIMVVLSKIPHYETIVSFPLNAIITIIFSLLFVSIGGKALGGFAKYFAFD